MPGRSIRIGTFAGIPFGVHPLWFVIFALITWTLGVGYYPAQISGIAPGTAWALGAVSALLLFASIVAHEYGHAIVARRRGVQVEGIDLWLLGGVARMRGEAKRPEDELAYAIAGPAVTLGVALVFGALALAVPRSSAPELHAVLAYQALINAVLLGFNLLPAFPLDGGRVLRALLWRSSGDAVRATTIAARIGRAFGFGLIAFGVLETLYGYPTGLWLAVVGWFLTVAAGSQALHAEVVEVFGGMPASELMTTPVVCIEATATAAGAIDAVILHEPHPAFPVIDGGRAVGMLTVDAIERVPVARRSAVRVAELVDRDPALLLEPGADVAALLDEPAFVRVRRAAVVDADGHPVGIVSITDVERSFAMHRRLAAAR
jgi:Zn-dependent protease